MNDFLLAVAEFFVALCILEFLKGLFKGLKKTEWQCPECSLKVSTERRNQHILDLFAQDHLAKIHPEVNQHDRSSDRGA